VDTPKSKSLKTILASKGLYDDSSGKAKEKMVILEFLRRLQLGNCHIVDNERPDFLLNFSSNERQVSVGVELTYYYADNTKRGSRQAEFQRQWKKFAKSLRERLDNEGGRYPYLYGAVHFHNSRFDLFKHVDGDKLIAEIIATIKACDGSTEPLSTFDIEKSPILAEHVHHIFLKDTAPERGIFWWPAHLQSGMIADPRQRLIEITADKNAKAKTFDWKSANEKWLLIYSESEGICDMVGIYSDPEIFSNLGDLTFDRVYVWNKYFETIEEIYPAFVTIFSVASEVLHRSAYPPAVRPFVFGPPESGTVNPSADA